MEISKLLKQEPNDCIDTSIGIICLFSITLQDQREIRRALVRPLIECESEEYLKTLIKYVCYPREHLEEDKYRPDEPILSVSDVELLNNDDLEKIAELYVSENPYLFREEVSKSSQSEDGKQVQSFELGEVKIPKGSNESYINYLHRLAIEKDKNLREKTSKIVDSIPDVSSFSNAIADQLKSTLSLGESLRNSMNAIRNSERLSLHENQSSAPRFDHSEIIRAQEERGLKPFNELSDRLDTLIDASALSADFMVEANNLQTEIAKELNKSSDTTFKQSSHNIKLVYVVVFLTFVSAASSAYSIWLNYSSDNSYAEKMVTSVDEALLYLQSIDRKNQSQEASSQTLIKEKLDDQGQKIESLQTINDSQGKMIQRLEKKLDELEGEKQSLPNQ